MSFARGPTPNSSLDCLNLQKAQIAKLDGTTKLSWLAPELVREFLQLYLRYKAARLPCLILAGIQLLGENIIEVGNLLGHVQDIVYVKVDKDLTPKFGDLVSWE